MKGLVEDTPLWRVALTVPERAVQPLETAFGEFALAVTSYSLNGDRWIKGESPWRVEFLTPALPDARALDDAIATVSANLGFTASGIEVTPLTERDWVATGLAQQPPTRAGRFCVHGRHDRGAAKTGERAIEIDAGLAFGTGHHETTWGCLDAIDRLCRASRIRNALDLGTGSGVLAIALAKARHIPVVAVEIDPVAVAVAQVNVRVNGVARDVSVRCGRVPPERPEAPFDLVVANILLRPLIRLAPRIAQALRPGGHAILAGILKDEEAALLATYRAQGLVLVRRSERGLWPTLVFRRGRKRGR